jgi:NitT/TauT family transport system substrate-binding protein
MFSPKGLQQWFKTCIVSRMTKWNSRIPWFLGLILLSACSKPKSPIRVGISPWPAYEVLFLASALGYYDGAPIQIVDYVLQQDVSRAYAADSIDLVANNTFDTLFVAAHGSLDRAILVLDISQGGDVIVSNPYFSNMRDLKGKTVGMDKIALEIHVLERALEVAGLALTDVNVVPLQFDYQEQAFAKGEVDAIVTYEPIRSKLLTLGGRVIFSSREIPLEIADVLVAHPEILANRHEDIQELVNGWFRGLAYLRDHPREAARILAPREGVSPEQFLKSLDGIAFPDLAQNRAMLGGHPPSLAEPLRRAVNSLSKSGQIQIPFEPTTLFDDRFVQASKP